MASSRNCTNCNCPCLVVSVGCIKSQLNPFVSTTPDDRVRRAIDRATIVYVLPTIGQACFTALCEALDADELPTGDEAYVELPTHYKTLVDVYLTELISDAATGLYIENFGFDRLGIQKEGEEAEDYLKRRLGAASAGKKRLKDWWELEETKTLFSGCVPEEDTDLCEQDDIVGLSTDMGDFAASTRYPSTLRESDPYRFDDPATRRDI